ncbi:fused MFS/spermidine synthase [Microbacteriaceae bacterium VKM Ac-2854]|nr:fused MFS/spermidine synthase [Microbacteriaceae bacterium VKM Ac-2854]
MSTSILLPSGRRARLDPDPFRDGALVLSIDGVEQSHLDLADPSDLALEYVRRIGFVVDGAATPGAPLRVLHLGGGALTLARYIAVTRPGSEQLVVEAETGLLGAVLDAAPLPLGTRLEIVEGDARFALPHGRRFDLLIVDVYVGLEVPPHLLDAGFAAELAQSGVPGAVVAVNVADEPGAPLSRAWRGAFAEHFAHTALIAAPAVLDGVEAGNVILLASDRDGFAELLGFLLRHGPHPATADA